MIGYNILYTLTILGFDVKITIIIIGILFIYIAFSTFFHETTLVGDIGKGIGETNLSLFGYLAYIDVLIVLYLLVRLYRNEADRKNLDFYLGWTLGVISLILLSALVFSPAGAGSVGMQIVSFLGPLIGQAGLWLFLLMTVALATVLMVDDEFDFNHLLKRVFKKREALDLPQTKKKRGFNNPFRASTLDDTFMPPLEEEAVEERPKRVKITKRSPRPKPVIQESKDESGEDTLKTIVKKEIEVPSNAKREMPFEMPIEDLPIFDEFLEDRDKGVVEKDTVSEPKKSLESAVDKKSSTSIPIVKELEENSKILAQIDKGSVEKPKNFKLPKIDFLQKAPKVSHKVNEEEIDRKIDELLSKLQQFKVDGDVVRTYSGPLVTTFEFKPAPHVKVSKILGLQDDLAMALRAETIRIQAPIPGRDVVGIEIPNEEIGTIYLRDILESKLFKESSSPLTVALGKDIVGNPFITDIKKLPHVLIAGTTGSGKSVGINAMILSLLYRNDPDQLKLMLIDPKMLEFSMYNDIPHLITPVIIEPMKAIAALANMVGEMERRYKLMAESRTKNIENYNEKVKQERSAEPFPFIVIVIDELADLMMNGGKEVELSIARLAQKSRACGIHLIVATQRPSVDVVTGLIKANLPSRLSYRVGQRIDSKVILDAMGAESLLGRGDGLFTPPGATGLVRIHAPWNTEDEIDRVVEFLKAQRLPEYDESYLVVGGSEGQGSSGGDNVELDALYEEAKSIILTDKKTSISYLQRKLQIGYNRSANIIEQLEKMGILSAPNAKGNRDIL